MDKAIVDALINALSPFADLLEEPATAITDENGLILLYVDPNDVSAAKDALERIRTPSETAKGS